MKKPYVPLKELCAGIAEEATELAQAALKVARIERRENPTPVPAHKAMQDVVEELADVAVVCDVIRLEPDRQIMMDKLKRWAERIEGGDGWN